MKNKILTGFLALGLSLTLAACGNSGGGDDKVLEDKDSAGWTMLGQYLLADGTENGWASKDTSVYQKSMMTAISIKDAKAIDKTVGEALAKKNVQYLYKYEGVTFGTNDAGWTTNFLKDGKLMRANGSYALKAGSVSYDADDEVYSVTQYIPDAHTANAEALTSNIFLPNWAEEKDDKGFDWTSNPVVTSGAGKYTVIVAKYKEVSSPTTPGYGIAAVKTSDVTGGIDYEEVVEFVPADHTYGLVGVIGGTASWDSDTSMSATSPYTVTVTLAANDQIKVRADAAWTYSWGYEALDTTASESTLTDVGGNIGIATAGSYTVTLTFTGSTAKLVVTK